MTDFTDAIDMVSDAGPQQAQQHLDANPDDAAQANDISKMTGADPSAVLADFSDYKQNLKGRMADQMIRSNPDLDAYIRSHPLAAAVSNDDLGQMDQLTRSASANAKWYNSIVNPIQTGKAAVTGFEEAYGPEPAGSWGYNPESSDLVNALRMAGTSLYEAPIRAFMAVPRAVSEAARVEVESALTKGGEDPNVAQQHSEDLAGYVEYKFMGGEGHPLEGPGTRLAVELTTNPEFRAAYQQGQRIYQKTKPWVDAGVEVPRGVSPELDAHRAGMNAEGVRRIQEDLDLAVQATTRERSSEIFQNAFNRNWGDAEMSVDGRTVAALYGDKTPTPDDGLLGWVPGIQDKLDLARTTDADVAVPIKDWLSQVDPAVAKQLNDDLRMWPQGVTAREAVELPAQPPRPPTVDSPLANVRDYLGTEPMNSVGDRKVTLERTPVVEDKATERFIQSDAFHSMPTEDQALFRSNNFHNFVMRDSTGRELGTLNISVRPDGGLYVDWIGGINGVGPRDIGPSAMRDILKQLKAEFPTSETVEGHRVSGARGEAGTYHLPSAMVKVKLDEAGRKYIELPQIKLSESGEHPEGWGQIDPTEEAAAFRKLLDEGYHQPMPHGYWYNDRIGLSWPEPMRPLMDTVGKELQRITGLKLKGADWMPVQMIGKGEKVQPAAWGQFWPFMDRLPMILVDMFGPNPVGTARHEAIHFLRYAGLITSSEWRVLQNAALEGGWLDKHQIHTRYSELDLDRKIEEAVAEEFKEWAGRADVKRANRLAMPFVQRIFAKMQDWWEGVKRSYADQTGKDPTSDALFQDIYQGEMKKGLPLHIVDDGTGKLVHWDDAAPIPMNQETGKFRDDALETQIEAMRASGAGLDIKSWNTIQRAIRERYDRDLEASQARAEKEQAKRQTAEWKANYRDVHKEVEAQIRQRPDIAAHLFLGSGELMGHKLGRKYRIATDSLTEEQAQALPKHYMGKEGLPLEGLSHMFGFPDGDSMVASLRDSYAKQGDKTPQEYLGGLTRAATDTEMERRYGFLEKNILEDAKDQALSDADINILAEEMHAAGMLAGQPVIDKAAAEAQAFDMFKKLTIKEAKGDTFLNSVARHARDIERSLLAGDHAEALVSMQKKLISMMLAKHARRVEKEVAAFDKQAKFLSQRQISSIDPTNLNYIHRVLMQVGKPVRRSIQDLTKETEARQVEGVDSFESWVDHVNNTQGFDMPVWPQLFDDNWKSEYQALTTEDFRAVNGSIKTMVHNGRTTIKIERSGETADREALIGNLIGTLDRFKELKYDVQAGPQEDARTDTRIPKAVRAFVADHIKMETFLNRLDHYDKDGDWNRYVMAQLFDGANQEDAWRKEYSAKLTALEDGEDLTKTVVNTIFRDPQTDGTIAPNTPLSRMTRAGLRAVMLNMGTEMNFTKLAKGFGVERDAVEAWVHTFATDKDWKFVKGVWDLFKDIKDRSDTMYRSMTGGVPSQDVLPRTVQTKYGNLDGGYYPLIAHPFLESKYPHGKGEALFDNNYVRASTPAGYMEQRTGAIYPVSLSLDSMPGRIAQMIHDVALRPAVTEVAKIFYDTRVQGAIRRHYGEEYKDMLVPYLRDIANSRNYIAKNQAIMNRASEFLRQNMITALVGLNPGTFLKHTPTALIQSMHEVGYGNFAKEFASMWAMNPEYGESNWKFAVGKSLELQRRDRHWMETLGGSMNELTGKGDTLRNRVQYWSSRPVAMGDMLSAVPTWLATYKKSLAEGRTEYDAVRLADRGVRRAHGSTSIADRPGIMRGGAMKSWMTTMYNFFNHIMNRQMEMVWKSGEAWDMAKQGEWGDAAKQLAPRVGELFAYVLAPALIEELVTPLTNAQTKQDHKQHSWARTAGMGLAYTLSSSWVGVRDVANGMLHGSDPTVGLLGTAYKTGTDFYRDLAVKDRPFSKDHAGRMIRDAMTLGGLMFGVPGQQVGRVGQFAHDVNVGKEKPKGPWGWLVGLRYGTTNKHSKTFQDWLRGKGH